MTSQFFLRGALLALAASSAIWSQTPSPAGDESRLLVGVEEAGASSSNPTAKLFLDWYISRPLGQPSAPSDPFGARYRWWGGVRIASMPIQTSAGVSSLVVNLVEQARSLTLNELAQSGEFQTGFEWRWPSGEGGPFVPMIHDREWTALGLIAGVGAALPFDPRSAADFFALPQSTTNGGVPLQRQAFNAQYPAYANTTATAVAFTTPDRNQLFRQWMIGARLTTLFQEGSDPSRSVGTVSFTIGQNEMVTGGSLYKFVAQVEGAYPLPISLGSLKLGFLYLFGRAALQLGSSIQQPPLLLAPMNPPADVSNVLVIARPSQRDLYTLGVGIDAVALAKNLFK